MQGLHYLASHWNVWRALVLEEFEVHVEYQNIEYWINVASIGERQTEDLKSSQEGRMGMCTSRAWAELQWDEWGKDIRQQHRMGVLMGAIRKWR